MASRLESIAATAVMGECFGPGIGRLLLAAQRSFLSRGVYHLPDCLDDEIRIVELNQVTAIRRHHVAHVRGQRREIGLATSRLRTLRRGRHFLLVLEIVSSGAQHKNGHPSKWMGAAP